MNSVPTDDYDLGSRFLLRRSGRRRAIASLACSQLLPQAHQQIDQVGVLCRILHPSEAELGDRSVQGGIGGVVEVDDVDLGRTLNRWLDQVQELRKIWAIIDSLDVLVGFPLCVAGGQSFCWYDETGAPLRTDNMMESFPILDLQSNPLSGCT